jgi:hypothetical protein
LGSASTPAHMQFAARTFKVIHNTRPTLAYSSTHFRLWKATALMFSTPRLSTFLWLYEVPFGDNSTCQRFWDFCPVDGSHLASSSMPGVEFVCIPVPRSRAVTGQRTSHTGHCHVARGLQW